MKVDNQEMDQTTTESGPQSSNNQKEGNCLTQVLVFYKNTALAKQTVQPGWYC